MTIKEKILRKIKRGLNKKYVSWEYQDKDVREALDLYSTEVGKEINKTQRKIRGYLKKMFSEDLNKGEKADIENNIHYEFEELKKPIQEILKDRIEVLK